MTTTRDPLIVWLEILSELSEILQEADDKLDEYGEPENNPLRQRIRKIIRYAKEHKKMEGT